MENKIRDCVPVINTNKKKCEVLDQLSVRISQVENQLKSNGAHQNKDAENLSVAIYGLNTCDDVLQTVNQLFYDRLVVTIADLRSLKDKQDLLYRKRYLRSHPVHSNVFIKSANTHTEQVMDANLSVVLNEMNNSKAYYVCDNGHIRPKPRENRDIRSNIAYGGGRLKTFTHNRDYGHITKDNSHLRYNDLDNVRYNRQDYHYNSGYKNNTRDRRQNNILADQQSNTHIIRRNSVISKTVGEPRSDAHTNRDYTKQYIDRCVHEINKNK